MRKNSQKNSRINARVQQELAEIIRGRIHDPRISPMTTVVSVQVAPDLKTCARPTSVFSVMRRSRIKPWKVCTARSGLSGVSLQPA